MAEAPKTTPETVHPTYELSFDQLGTLVDDLLVEQPPQSDEPTFIVRQLNGLSKHANIGRHIERTVFEKVFGNTNEAMAREYGPYEAASLFFILLDSERHQAAGVLRVITDSAAGFKTLNDVQNKPFNLNLGAIEARHNIHDTTKLWDVGTVAVLPEYRYATTASIQLYGAMLRQAGKQGIEHIVSLIHESVYEDLVKRLGIPFVPLGGAKPAAYLGSNASYAVYGYIPEFPEKITEHMQQIASTPAGKRLSAAVLGQLFGQPE